MIRPIGWLRIIIYFLLFTTIVINIILLLMVAGKIHKTITAEDLENGDYEVGFTKQKEENLFPPETDPDIPMKAPTKFNTSSLPWFFKNGTIRPTPGLVNEEQLWPEGTDGDRIINQLMYLPSSPPEKMIKIAVYERKAFGITTGRKTFEKCPVNNCIITNNETEADAVLHRNHLQGEKVQPSAFPNQIWIFFTLENPIHVKGDVEGINLIATYRTTSDIVAPYAKWVYYDEEVKRKPQPKNYANGKSKKVAWVVSNCHPKNARDQYAKELAKYIDVDIYGTCGTLQCPRNEECRKKLEREYKFYLSFENGNCREYMTEKFFGNALSYDILPIVRGAPLTDYKKSAPLNSFLHVDPFTSPRNLANYLHYLDENDSAYNSFFEWKGTGEFINTYFFCRVCAMLHSGRRSKTYQNLKKWWAAPGSCMEK